MILIYTTVLDPKYVGTCVPKTVSAELHGWLESRFHFFSPSCRKSVSAPTESGSFCGVSHREGDKELHCNRRAVTVGGPPRVNAGLHPDSLFLLSPDPRSGLRGCGPTIQTPEEVAAWTCVQVCLLPECLSSVFRYKLCKRKAAEYVVPVFYFSEGNYGNSAKSLTFQDAVPIRDREGATPASGRINSLFRVELIREPLLDFLLKSQTSGCF